jgi:hypothetical protein
MTRPITSKQDFLSDCKQWCEGFQSHNNVLIAYVRRGKRPPQNLFVQTEQGTLKLGRQGRKRPQGVVAAYRGQDGVIRIGWSLCRKTEPFNSKVGLRYALERAIPVTDLKTQAEIAELEANLEGVQKHVPEEATNSMQETLNQAKAQCPPQSVRKTLAKLIERTEKL